MKTGYSSSQAAGILFLLFLLLPRFCTPARLCSTMVGMFEK